MIFTNVGAKGVLWDRRVTQRSGGALRRVDGREARFTPFSPSSRLWPMRFGESWLMSSTLWAWGDDRLPLPRPAADDRDRCPGPG